MDKPSRPALADMSLTQRRANIRILLSVALAAFLIGAATIAIIGYAAWFEKQARPGGSAPWTPAKG